MRRGFITNEWIYVALLAVAVLTSCKDTTDSSGSGDLDGLVVVKETAKPVGGAVVSLNNRKEVTETDGKYFFSDIPVGSHEITVSVTGYQNVSDTVKIGSGYNYDKIELVKKDSTIGDSTSGGSASLTGTVEAAGLDKAISGAVIGVGNRKDTTDQDGKYAFDALEPGVVTVNASAKGYAHYSHDLTIDEGHNVFDIELGKESENTGSLSGIVYQTEISNPVAEAVVAINDRKDTTDDGGNYSFSNLPTGSYPVTVTASDYEKTTQSVTIGKGQNTFNIALKATGSLSGTVTEKGSDKKISGVIINVDGETATTGKNGTYSMDDIPVGTYNLTAKADNYEDYAKSVDIRRGDNNKLDIVLTPRQQYANVHGTVTNSLGLPISHVSITLNGNQVYTDAGGNYRFQSIPYGQYEIKAVKSGYEDYSKTLSLATPDYRLDFEMKLSLLSPPKNPAIEKDGDDDVRLSWDKINDPNLEGYNVYNVSDTTTPVNGSLIPASTPVFTATNLSPGIYAYRVASVNNDHRAGRKSAASDPAFIFQDVHNEDFEDRRLNPEVWSSSGGLLDIFHNHIDRGFQLTDDHKYVIDGDQSLLYEGHDEHDDSADLYSESMIPSLDTYTATVRVRLLSGDSRFLLELDDGQTTGSKPAVGIRIDGKGAVTIGYEDGPDGNVKPAISYDTYSQKIFHIGLFVDKGRKSFSILNDGVAVYTAGYTQPGLNRLYMYFENGVVIDDVETGRVD